MADVIKNLLGGLWRSQQPLQKAGSAIEDADFADFAGTPVPSPAFVVSAINSGATAASATASSALGENPLRPYTKWYNVHERVELKDFYSEMFIVPFLIIVVAIHFLGTRKNKRKAKQWMVAHAPILQSEFACLGFSNRRTRIDERSFEGADTFVPPGIMKERGANEYITFVTGRQNVAFVDIKLGLAKRNNPMSLFAANVIAFFFDSMPAPKERMEATSYVFDGKEADLVPAPPGGVEEKREKFNSTYDPFVWAVVHKEAMQYMRDGRYDLSLTTTKENAKLSNAVTVMSESAEITDFLLTSDMVKAINEAGDDLVALVISDQPVDKPLKLNDALSKKRLSLILRLPSTMSPTAHASTLPLFTQFLRLPDLLVQSAHFRPEVIRRVKATREEEIKKIKRVDEDEKAEERKMKIEKDKRKDREDKMKAMSSEQQKKFLEKERQAEMRKNNKKRTMKG